MLVASLASEQLPALQIENIDGYLLGTLQAERVEWHDDVVEVSVTELSFDWNPLCLLNTTLCIGSLQAKQLDIVVLNKNDDKKDAEGVLPEIIMPLGFDVSSAKIDELRLKIGESEYKVTKIDLSGGWFDSLLALDALEAEYQELKLVTEGELDFSLPWRSRFGGDLSYNLISATDKKNKSQQNPALSFKLKGEQLSFDVDGDLSLSVLKDNAPAKLSASVSFDEADFPLVLKLVSPVSIITPSPGLAVNINTLSADISLKALSIASKLEGEINDQPITASGDFSLASGLLMIEDLLVKSGNNQISGHGESQGENYALNFKVLIPEPEIWLPDLKGHIEGNAQINGSLNNADIRGELKVSDLAVNEYALQSALLNFDIKKSAHQSSVLSLNMQGVKLGGVTVEKTEWQLKGDKNQAKLQAELHVKNRGVAELACDVKYLNAPNDRVKTVCDEFSWLSNIFPDADFAWRNKDSITINWDTELSRIALEPFCLSAKSGEICNSELASWSQDKGYSVSLNAERISLQRQNHRWPEWLKLNGILSASARVSQKPDETIDADITVTLPKGDFSLVNSTEKRPLHITVDDLTFKASMHRDQLSLNSRFTSPQLGDIQGQLLVADIGGKRELTGGIDIGKLDLSYLEGVIPSVETLSGYISSQLEFSGVLTKPFIEGDFKLAEGELKSDYFPETLRQINITANFDQQTLNYLGSFESDGGKATLDGELDWQQQWVLKTSLVSKAFKITPRSGIDLTIKPTLSLLLKEGEVDVSGKLEIPKARVELKGLPAEAKSVSPDVKVVGRETEELSRSHWKYNANINIVLGKDVHFRGFGVNTYLTGNLLLSQKENGAFTGTGQVLTEDGFYTIWGQRLTVKEGRFNFSGPLDEPDLQLDATRTISGENVTVGVRVTGSASDPEINFYSQPAMNETKVLHYLLTGQSPDQGTNSSSLLNNMVLSAGVFGSSEITEKLASKVGVSDFQIATSGDEDGTSLELSGYISPDIYLKYGVSLYDDAKTVAMRYRLKQNLFVEAASGINSSLDIIYSFERR